VGVGPNSVRAAHAGAPKTMMTGHLAGEAIGGRSLPNPLPHLPL